MDIRLHKLARQYKLRYFRYADDITFSGNRNVFQKESAFRKRLDEIISEQNFTINEKKTRLQRKGERQEVTGLIVSDRVNVTREYVRGLDNLLYIWEKYGETEAYARFLVHYTPKLLAFIKELYDNPDNKEFAAGIESMVLNDLKYRKENSKIDEIFELCIRQFLKEQAEDMYKDFPLVEIAQDLSVFYMEMENARRKNDIEAFGFSLFKQLELITGILVKDKKFVENFDTLRIQKPFIIYDIDLGERIRVEDKIYSTVEDFIFIKDRISNTYKSKGKSLDSLTAIEKIKAVLYIVVNKGEVPFRHEQLNEDYRTLQSIYNLRNRYAHNGNNANENQDKYYIRIISAKTKNSLKYLNFLRMFVQGVLENHPMK